MPDSLQLQAGKRIVFSVPWADVETISHASVSGLSALWRILVWPLGWAPQRELAHIRLRRMPRQSPLTFRVSTRGLGVPGFTRQVYLAPDDVDAFIDCARGALRDR